MKKIKGMFSEFISSCFLVIGMLLAVLDWKHGIGANHRPM